MHWDIGNARVTLIRDIQTAVDAEGMFPGSDPAVLDANADWLRPHFLTEEGTLPLSIHSLVIESMGQVIVVDTCLGSRPIPGFDAMSHLQTEYLTDFVAAGFDLDAVDVVTCTHLHFDHVGFNTHLVDGKWVPTFPNARYLFGRIEYEHWDAGGVGVAITFGDAVKPVFDAGMADLVEMDHRVNDEVWFEPTPGHSPGHMSVRISSNGVDAVITGDMVHHPIQFVAPHWPMSADSDSEQASKTRLAFIEKYADAPVQIFGTHFGGPSTGRLVRAGESLRFVV